MPRRPRTIVLIGAGLMALGLWVASGRVRAAGRAPKVVEVSAERFRFTPSEIRVKAGSPLELRLTSDDTDHGFHIVNTDIDVRIPKRGRGATTIVFDPPGPGRYTFACSHVCGAGHSFMRGTIVVTE